MTADQPKTGFTFSAESNNGTENKLSVSTQNEIETTTGCHFLPNKMRK